MENLFEQITQITKAHAYDIVSEQNKELQQENIALKYRVKYLEDLIREYTFKMKVNLSGGRVDEFLKEQITPPEPIDDIPKELFIRPNWDENEPNNINA